MSELFDLSNFDEYKEDNCREVSELAGNKCFVEEYQILEIRH